MIPLLFFAVQAGPVPANPIRQFDHEFVCTVFSVTGERQRISVAAKARSKWIADVVITSLEEGSLPVGTFRASTMGPTQLAVKAPASDGEEYTYMFARTAKLDARPSNGTVIVSKMKWPQDFNYVATGVCDFSSKIAE